MTHEVVLQGYNVKPGSLQLGTFDSYGIEELHVTADDSWDGLDILAVFHAPNGTAKKVVVGADGMLAVPPEATAKQAGVGRIVFVGLAENVQRITVDMGYNIKPHSDIEGDNPGTPTPDVVQQILTEAQNANVNSTKAKKLATDAKDIAQNVRTDADNGKFTGAKGDKGDDGTTPQLKIGEDNLWNVSYDNGETWVSLGVKGTGDAGKDGEDGVTPHIGENGNWWLGDTDTGVSAKGPAGERGPAGEPGPENLVIITATASTTVLGEYIPDTTYTKALADIQANKAVMIKLENVPGRYYIPYSSSNAEILASAGTVSGSNQSIELYLLKWTASNNTITITGTKEGCIADGGTAGQVLVKKSAESFDTEWKLQYKIVKYGQPFNKSDLINLFNNGTLIYVYNKTTYRLYTIYALAENILYGISGITFDATAHSVSSNRCQITDNNKIALLYDRIYGVANNGTTGQILAKKSNTNGDTEWIDPPSVEIPEDYPQIREDVSQLKEDIENTNSILEENLVRISANLINPYNMLENTAITISNRISTSSNTTYKSYLNIPVKAGESYYIGNSHRVSCVIDSAENKLVLQSNTQNKTGPFIFNVEKSGLLCVCFYMTEEKPWVALAEKETEYEEYGSKLLQEWLKLQIEKYGYSNPLKGKTIYNFGDSISNGQGNLVGDKRLGPAELVALDNDMICTDFAVSGSTMSTAGGGNYTLKRINDAISASPITPDFVLLAGGINDLKVTSVGDFSEPSSNDDFGEKYIGLLDTSNFSGAFETAIYRILNAWPGTQLIYMTEHKMPSHYNDGTETLYQTAKKICKKWCVPILDMWNSGGLNMSVLANNKAYGTGDVNLDGTHTDTTHPNGEAYRLYYVPKLKSKLLECCPKTS